MIYNVGCFSAEISMSPPDLRLRNQSGFQPALERFDPKSKLTFKRAVKLMPDKMAQLNSYVSF